MNDHLAAFRRMATPGRRSIVELIAGGELDAELAALVWLLVEARLPLVVAGLARNVGKTTLLEAMLDFLPPTARRVDLAGADEDFAWLPEATALGWSSAAPVPTPQEPLPVTPATGYLVAGELSEHLPIYTWGRAARTLVRAASIGYGIAATIHADRLEDVHDELRSAAVGLTDDELSYLGLVLVLRPVGIDGGHHARRVVAAHYARPVGRDEHGHVQRLPPAVLAVHDEHADRLEHFAWGIMPELALRLGRRSGDLEAEQRRRAAVLDGLVRSGTVDVESVRAAIREARAVGEPSGTRPN
ncbi:MAG TPA: hypothetical protein VFI34_02845 [Candidatus Limnocylindrales bacterium]|nr:hypothetical protein [Candidatus Limnocylindrales bacterium]